MPHLQFNIVHGYLANENQVEALRHFLNVCLVSNPAIFHSRLHPVRVSRLYMLLCVL